MTRGRFRAACAVLAFAAVVGFAPGARGENAGYRYYENFAIKDDQNRSLTVDIEKHTSYAHQHARVKDRKYEIVVPGNRHFFATPKLSNFNLQLGRATIVPHTWVNKVGFEIYFHWDREKGEGHVFEVYHTQGRKLIIKLDGTQLYERQDPQDVNLKDQWYTLNVNGKHGEFYEGNNRLTAFTLPSEGTGSLGIDSTYAPSLVFTVDTVEITSKKAPAKTRLKEFKFALRQVQGASLPITYDVTLDRYETGEVELNCQLSGTVASRKAGDSVETGGTEWGTIVEVFEEPYLRVEAENGYLRYLPIFNGERVLNDCQPIRGKPGKCGPWPVSIRTVFHDLPEKFTIAAGYRHFLMDPWRYLSNDNYEQIRDQDGRFIYEGETLRGKSVGVRMLPPKDNATARAIPKTAVRYAEALRHAQEGGYFRESEKVSFSVETWWRANEWAKEEVLKPIRFTDVYGGELPAPALTEREVSDERVSGGFRKVVREVTLGKNPGNGVYKIHCAGRTFVFEVLSDDPNALPPPLASGLPFLYSMPNETKYLEQSAFDPWNPFAGASHYYATDAQYAAIGEALKVWEVLPIYNRGWIMDCTTRNSGDTDITNEHNRELIRHARYLNGGVKRTSRMRIPVNTAWRGEQFEMLKRYILEEKPPVKLLTPKRLDEIEKRREMTVPEIRDLFESGWERFLSYDRKWSTEAAIEDAAYLRSVNPKVGRAGYGPLQPYYSVYRMAYSLRYNGPAMPAEARLRENGDFWVYEDYHHSCDYPLYRAALLLTSYDFHYGDVGRKVYPEIYTSARSRCLDGAVFQAHPFPTGRWVRDSHQRKIVYGYVYGTPQYRDGAYRFWRDWGFHARSHELGCLEEIVYAWDKVRKNTPVASAKAAFIMDDLDQIRLRGDHFDDEYNTLDCGWPFGEIVNTGEEGLAYLYEKTCEAGYTTPVISDFGSLDRLTPEMTDFVVLPPIVRGTPKRVIDSIRAAYDRGISLICSEECEGLEDIFGVERLPSPRKVGALPGEPFKHKLSVAKYAAKEAKPVLFGAEAGDGPFDIPVVLVAKGRARTAFVNVPPSCVNRNSFRYHYHFGHESVSQGLKAAMRKVFRFLAPAPSVKTERGLATASVTERGDLMVVVADESPIYNDTDTYPVPFRFTVRVPGIGRKRVETDAEDWSVLSRGDDELVIRISLDKDVARYFRFYK